MLINVDQSSSSDEHFKTVHLYHMINHEQYRVTLTFLINIDEHRCGFRMVARLRLWINFD